DILQFRGDYQLSTQVHIVSLHDALPISATARATRATVISRGRARSWICTAMSALLPFLHCRHFVLVEVAVGLHRAGQLERRVLADRKSTRLNSSHVKTSYAVFCLKKK